MRISDIDHRVPGSRCPLCGHKLDAAMGIDSDEPPDPGDYSVCINCASPLVYNDDLSLRLMTGQELRELHPQNRRELEAGMATARRLDRRR